MEGGVVRFADYPFTGKFPFPNLQFENSHRTYGIQNFKIQNFAKKYELLLGLRNQKAAIPFKIQKDLLEFKIYCCHQEQIINSTIRKRKKGAKRGKCQEAKNRRRKIWFENKRRGSVTNNLIRCKTISSFKAINLPRVFYTNPTSLNDKKLEIVDGILIDHDIGVFTETWWKDGNSSPHLVNFQLFHKNRSNFKKGGGVAIFVRDNLNPKLLNLNLKHNSNIEFLSIIIKPRALPYNISCIVLIVIYISPQWVVKLHSEIKSFLVDVINAIKSKYARPGILLLGDFNRWKYYSFCKSSSLDQIVHFPTFYNSCSTSYSNLDLIFTNLGKFYQVPSKLPH